MAVLAAGVMIEERLTHQIHAVVESCRSFVTGKYEERVLKALEKFKEFIEFTNMAG